MEIVGDPVNADDILVPGTKSARILVLAVVVIPTFNFLGNNSIALFGVLKYGVLIKPTPPAAERHFPLLILQYGFVFFIDVFHRIDI